MPSRDAVVRNAAACAKVGACAALVLLASCSDEPTAPHDALITSASAVRDDAHGLFAQRSSVIPGQYIVTFADSVGVTRGLARALVAQHGGEVAFEYSVAVKGFSARLPAQA